MSLIKIHKDLPQEELPQREERLRKFLFEFFCTKRFFFVFILSVEGLLEADPNDFFLFGTFLCFFS
jgi:hypothetical protein